MCSSDLQGVMHSSKSLFNNKLPIIAFLVISFIGFLDATYLAVEHFLGRVPVCNIIEGCDIVTTSKYATIGGIPIAFLGAIYYITLFILTIVYLDTKRISFMNLAARMSGVGFVTSLYLIYLQLFVLNAICLYCMISATTSTLLFAIGFYILKNISKTLRRDEM